MTESVPGQMSVASIYVMEEQETYWSPIAWKRLESPHQIINVFQATAHPTAIKLMEAARATQEADRERKRVWIEEKPIDAGPHVADWDTNAKRYGEKLLSMGVIPHAMLDGLVQANEAMRYGLEMDKANVVSEAEIAPILTSIFRIQLWDWAARELLGAESPLIDQIVGRVVARELPTRDNVSSEPRHAYGRRNENPLASPGATAGRSTGGGQNQGRVFGVDAVAPQRR